MFYMFEILLWFPIFLVAGYVCEKIFWRDYGPFKVIIYAVGFIGIAIHEICHYTMCILVGVRPRGIGVKLKSEVTNAISPHGYVDPGDENKSFMQAFLIGFAPLFFSTWFFFLCLHIIFFNSNLNGSISPENMPYIVLGCGFVCVSLLVGMTPSKADLGFISRAFKQDARYSIYQISLVFVSGFLVWLFLVFFTIVLLFDIFYYAIVFLFYYFLKYSLYLFGKLVSTLLTKDSVDYDEDTIDSRSRHKPLRPHQLKIKESQW